MAKEKKEYKRITTKSLIDMKANGEKIAMRFGDFHSRRLAEYLGLTDHGGMLRVSMVHYNTIEEVDRFTTALDRILAGEAGLAKAS